MYLYWMVDHFFIALIGRRKKHSVIKAYASFVKRTYGKATVMFDGYSCNPSIKDMTHVRRQGNHKSNY